jgi:serine protease AprX
MQLEREWVEDLIFGTELLRRFTQDSPVLPDVWLGYANNLDQQLDLLLTPHLGVNAGDLSQKLRERLSAERLTEHWRTRHGKVGGPETSPRIAYNQANVVVRLWFDELIRVVLPLSSWFNDQVSKSNFLQVLKDLAEWANLDEVFRNPKSASEIKPELIWMIRLIGSIEVALEEQPPEDTWDELTEKEHMAWWRKIQKDPRRMVQAVGALMTDLVPAVFDPYPLWTVSQNRPLFLSISRSVPAIKADAAYRLFNISCQDVTWAIIDSGIDAKHKAFLSHKPDSISGQEESWEKRTRVVATYDFSLIRHLLSADGTSDPALPAELRQRLEENLDMADDLRRSIIRGRNIDWSLIEHFLTIPHKDPTYDRIIPEHGTHVAGILAADARDGDDRKGVCPNIKLYDFRVFDQYGEGDEFSVIAALQFVRHLNANKDFLVVHGVNLSLSIRHDVANFACGRTPVCEECERLVGAGVVVVAAAGNQGYLQYMTSKGPQEGYLSISITDPGNADGVITVGATHRSMPHTYGVSYFSSRGPTGDGRIKPDLVAPGEKIESSVPGSGNYKVMDGTSMAAPHVSGAAALLIARHPELAGQPRRIKQILCDTATDLGREKYFQGCGMVDVLRALQSV